MRVTMSRISDLIENNIIPTPHLRRNVRHSSGEGGGKPNGFKHLREETGLSDLTVLNAMAKVNKKA